MTDSLVFAGGVAITAVVALGIVGYLSGALRQQLLELCGNGQRVEFWAAFSNVTLVLTPTIFAMSAGPSPGSQLPALFAIANQLKWGFVGLVLSVLTLAWTLSRFIPRTSVVSLLQQPEKN